MCERLSPPPSTLLLLFQSTWLRRSTRGASSPAHSAPSCSSFYSTSGPSRSVPCTPRILVHRGTTTSRGAVGSCRFDATFFSRFLEEPQSGSVTLLRPSPGKCADIAVRHRFRNLSDVVASAERAGGGSSWRWSCWWWWWDLLWNTSWQCWQQAAFKP